MTTPGNLICSKCGYSNVPGDQFGGSCGTFLEWGAVPGEPAAGPLVVPAPLPAPGPGPVPGPPSLPTGSPATPGTTTGALIRCPSCGIANPPDRTFCQSCGSKLSDAGRVTAATPEQIAMAVNQGPVVRASTPKDLSDEQGGSGGRARALIVVCVIGALLGVGVIVGYALVRGGASSGASPNPSAASSGAPVPSSSGKPAGSTPPVAATRLAITGIEASSSAKNFPAENADDQDPHTAWKEGAKQAEGESITLTFDAATVSAILVSNGFSASTDTYKRNPRLREVEISVNHGPPKHATLKDTPNEQRIALDAPIDGATTVRLTIVSQYPGQNVTSGKATQSAALGEIVVMGVTTP